MTSTKILNALLGLSIATIILFSQVVDVAAINDQGLVWGIEVNDRFDYDVELEFHNSDTDISINDKMYVIVNELNTIPDHVTLLSHITIFSLSLGSYTTYWENGTTMDSLWLGIMNGMNPFVAYPIGNWRLLGEIFEDSAPAVITQNATMMNCSLVDYPIPGNVHETIFLKNSGVPSSQLYIRTWDSDTTLFMNLTMITTSPYPGDGGSALILILGGVVASAIVIIVIVRVRRK
ncbi:MAG: hypothetical protein ACFFEF_19005 [Candidatus Thorarchaeota archaeon]